MIYAVFFLVSLFFCFFVSLHFKWKDGSIIRFILEANNLFCIQYLLFSSIFILLDTFSVWKPILCIVIIDFIILLICKMRRVERQSIIFRLQREEWVMLMVLIVSLPLILVTTEDIGTASDQGAYFLHTITYMEEKSEEIHILKEKGISEIVDEGLWDLQEAMTCYYHKENDDFYYIFALGTWCSLPALFGKMFGMWKCMRAVNYLYILVVCNMFYLCRKMAESKMGVYLSLGLFALSPLILYIGKAGLTEVVMVLLGLIGFHYILENKKWFYIFGGISIGLIGFVHISMFVYMPIITLLAAIESIKSDKRYFAIFNIIQMSMFAISIWYAYTISPIYVEKQYGRFTFHGRLSYLVLFIGIDIFVLSLVLYQIWIYYRKKSIVLMRIQKCMYQYFKPIVCCVLLIVFIRTLYYAYFLCFTDKFAIPEGYDAGSWNLRSNYVNTGLRAISYLNIVNIARATGGVGFLAFLVVPFLRKNVSEKNISLYYIGLYGIFVYAVIQMDTPFNYYASRYFVPFVVPTIILSLVSFVDSKKWCTCILFGALLFNHRYWFAFGEGGPKVGQYQILQDALSVIPSDAIVFCNPNSESVNVCLSSNLRILNDNEVYNLKNYEEVSQYYLEKDKYVISEQELEDFHGNIAWSHTYLSQYSFGNGKYGSYDTGIGTYEIPLYIYKMAD